MKISFLIFVLFGCSSAFGCSDAMKPYEFECKTQDRFERLSNEFRAYSISMTELKGFKIPKAIGKLSYFSDKNDLLNQSEATLSHNIDWLVWNNGQKFINNLSPVYLEFSDILKLHKILFTGKSFRERGLDAGKLRTFDGETNPKISMKCDDKTLNENLFNILFEYDLKSVEGYPLLSLKNIGACEDKNYSAAELYFYKGASVKIELTRWLTDLNDMIARYENGEAPVDISPYNYLADMRRWFLAIRPFNAGNEQVVTAFIDYTASRLQLPPFPSGDVPSPIYLTVEKNREANIDKINETLTFFEGCLFETKTRLISYECNTLK